MSRILLGVTGGIAAYKACELTRLLVKAGHEVVPLVTPGAQRFVTEETFLALARRPRERGRLPAPDARRPARRRAVHREHAREARARDRRQRAHRGGARPPRPDARRAGDEPAHVGARRRPARTSRRCSRAASSSSAPTRARWPRASGASAGWPSRHEIAERASRSCSRPGALAGKRVLVTAGGTREPLDSVRFLGNRSSGRMGVALAEEARRRGAEVILLAANLSVDPPHGVETIPTPTAESMLRRRPRPARRRRGADGGRRRRLPAGRGARRRSGRRTSTRGRSS